MDSLHSLGRRFVPILDPGIKLEPGYAPYDDAVAQNLFLKDVTGDFYIGEVWPGACHFPDFLNPASLDWWAKHIGEFYEKVPFDGLWIDMNEVRRRVEEFFFFFFFKGCIFFSPSSSLPSEFIKKTHLSKLLRLPSFSLSLSSTAFLSKIPCCRPQTSAPATSARSPPRASTSTT